MRTGQYDIVSASGDATLRLIAAGDVEPMNTDLITNYPDIFDALKNQPWNSVRDVPTASRTAAAPTCSCTAPTRSSPRPTRGRAVFDEASK